MDPISWQPIETAPLGTMILFCSMKADTANKWAFVDWIFGSGRTLALHPKWTATHWMPLPEPPK